MKADRVDEVRSTPAPELSSDGADGLRAACPILVHLGTRGAIEKITVREITERAGYNRATFYLYFRDVYDLFEQLEDEILSQVRALVDNRLLAGDTLDFSNHMGFIVGLAQRFDGYMPRLIAGDPSFGERLKQIIAGRASERVMSETKITRKFTPNLPNAPPVNLDSAGG